MDPNEPTPTPPSTEPAYAPYYRGGSQYGSAERLEALGKGYFALNWVFFANVILAVGVNVFDQYSRDREDLYMGVLLVGAGVLFVIITAATYVPNQNIAKGMGWAPAMGVLASVLMGLNSALCCGVIGYLVMQLIAAKEIKRYGVQKMKKPEIEAAVAAMRSAPQAPVPPSGFQV